jgi:hypothetical protein
LGNTAETAEAMNTHQFFATAQKHRGKTLSGTVLGLINKGLKPILVLAPVNGAKDVYTVSLSLVPPNANLAE